MVSSQVDCYARPMRALSVKQPWAELIARGDKKIEYRTWSRDFRGDLLIVASKGRNDDEVISEGFNPDDLVYGAAVCIVDFTKVTGEEGDYEWHLANPRRVEPVPITGYASIYNVEDADIRPMASGAKAPARAAKGRRKATVEQDDDEEDDLVEPSVVVVDDDPARMGRSVEAVASQLGVAPDVCFPGGAMELLKIIEPEVLVLPTMMTVVSGLEIVLNVRKTRWGKKCRILLLDSTGTKPDSHFSFDEVVPAKASAAVIQKGLERLVRKR